MRLVENLLGFLFCRFQRLGNVVHRHLQHHVRRHAPGTVKLVGGLRIHSQFLRQSHGGIGHPRLKLLVLALVLADLDVPVHQLGSESRILSPATNRLAQIFLIHGHIDHLVLLVQGDGPDQRRFESVGHEGFRFVTPADDVHLLVVEFAHDILHPRSTQADAGTDRIHLLIIAENCHLGPVAGLPRDPADFHRLIRNLAHLRLKEPSHEIRVTAGENNFRTPELVVHGDHIRPDTISDVVVLGRHSLPRRHAGFELSEVDHDIVLFKAPYRSTHDVAGAILELVIDHLLLGLAQPLHHGLLGSLHRNTPEILGRHV